MIDTINLTLFKESVPNIDLMAEISPYLTSITGEGLSYGVPTIYGKLNNLDVVIRDDKVNVKNGSLCKYYLGNNLSEMGIADTQKSIESLSDLLHLPIEKSIVSKLHFGMNLMLSNEPILYYKYLGNCVNFERLVQPHGINYKLADRELALYDKIKELKHHREPIHPLYKDRFVLRIEGRLNKNIAKHFNMSRIEAKFLYNEDFYLMLISNLQTNYEQINKLKIPKLDMNEITTRSKMQKLGVLALIEQEGGLLRALENLEERYKQKKLTKKQNHDLKNLYLECSKMKLQTMDSDLIIELDRKVNEKFKYWQ